MIKIKEILPNEEFIFSGHVFTLSLDNGKAKFKHVRKHTGKVKREIKTIEPPKELDVRKYAIENGYDPEFMWEKMKGYIDAGMKDSHNNEIKNWKLKLNQVWFQPQYKLKQTTNSFEFKE